MIGYLEGTRSQTLHDSILLLTAGGVGYQLNLPAPLLAQHPPPGAMERFFVSTVVRDSEIALYGFDALEGKTLFETLLKVSGVGPKVAVALLSAFSPKELAEAVVTENAGLLATIPGIGKKTATRICLDLQDRLAKWDRTGMPPPPHGDLASALTNLGFPEKEVFTALRGVSPGVGNFSDQLREALSLLTRR